jgi:hypothetical protein
MKKLTKIHFVPPVSGTLYFAEGRFQSLTGLAFSDLPSEQQAAVAGAMQWLGAMAEQLGFVSITEVWLQRLGDVQIGTEEDPETSPAFLAEITGTNAEGLTGSEAIQSVPGQETNAMAQLWDGFESSLNP